ncbi:hypothetical protein [Pseudoalteromonas sp. bablab_jr010]|uniref:hypothetical protein n=1 Tax=Pseudoalteromonas sp. bablab_jr010 TaxID=2755063 RepID=UPI0018F3457A|nr:hypothetical protein [Pseudoalteromonas sp. bablab_jr010]
MAAFTASQASVTNGSKVVQINSGESVANVSSGDFLVLAGFIVEINRAYVGSDSKGYFELVKNWSNSNQSNQECIVVPTTGEFKKAVEALSNANVLVNDNFKALQDWQTKMGTVTFSNQDGTTTTVKTLKQIEADNQAQMDAYHPHPWAMRKVEFEAMRAANNEKFAASGFFHLGKNYDVPDAIESIGEGLYIYKNGYVGYENSIYLGAHGDKKSGISKKDTAHIHIAGVLTDIFELSIRNAQLSSKIKLPPAEDGTRTYDSGTGISVSHATPAIAFAAETATNKVVTDREDVWGIYQEVREINEEYPFVYKNGLPQSLASDIYGVPTVSNNVQGIEYFAQYDGDISSRGRGVNWLTATEEERRTIASNPKNKIKFDDQTGKFYQTHNFAITFRGIGNGSWQFVDVQNTATLRFDLKTPVTNSDGSYFTGYNNAKYNKECIGVYQKVKGNDLVEDSYLLLCGTVNRRNTGLYHDSFNKLGTAKAIDDKEWHNTAQSFTSKADCFDPAKVLANSGSIASSKSGAPDGRYYDAIYASGQGGVCRDMRYSSWGLKQEDFADADLAIKAGGYRGREYLTITRAEDLGNLLTSGSWSNGEKRVIFYQGNLLFDTQESQTYNVEGYIISKVDRTIRKVLQVGYSSGSDRTGIYLDGPLSDAWTDESYLIFSIATSSSVAGEYTHTEVVGDPANILLCDDLKDGWVGSWNPTIPDGVKAFNTFTATKPSVDTTLSRTITTDNGATWSDVESDFSLITNSMTASSAMASGRVEVWNYTVKARSTKPVGNTKILGGIVGLGSVFASMDAGIKNARYLAFSLISKILTHPANTSNVGQETLTLLSSSLLHSQGILWASNKSTGENKHTPLSLGIPTNAGPAFKALDYNVVENQQAFINYAYTELTYDAVAGDWGDDSKIHPVDNQATMLDENGHTVLVGTARCVEPLGWLKNDK